MEGLLYARKLPSLTGLQSPRNFGGQQVTPAQNLPYQIKGANVGPSAGPGIQVASVGEPHRYARIVRGRAMVDWQANTGLGYNPQTPILVMGTELRNLLVIRNTSGNSVGLSFGAPVDINNPDWLLGPNGFIGFDVSVPQDDLYAQSIGNVGVVASIIVWNYSTIKLAPAEPANQPGG